MNYKINNINSNKINDHNEIMMQTEINKNVLEKLREYFLEEKIYIPYVLFNKRDVNIRKDCTTHKKGLCKQALRMNGIENICAMRAMHSTYFNLIVLETNLHNNSKLFDNKTSTSYEFKNDQSDKIIDIKVNNYTGKPRHYSPLINEWYNSIYTFNKNVLKLLPALNKTLLKLIKSYFNFYSYKLEKKIKSPTMRIKARRLSPNRILTSKPQLKHTSDQTIITLYIYNRQVKYYLNRLKRIGSLDVIDTLLPYTLKNVLINKNNENFIPWPSKLKINTIKNKAVDMFSSKVNEQKNSVLININTTEKVNTNTTINLYANNATAHAEDFTYILSEQVVKRFFHTADYLSLISSYCLKYYAIKSLREEILSVYIKQLIYFNNSKFDRRYLQPLINLVNKIYNKNIQFNIVDLKYLYLNSYIFSETLLTKLKNRKNNVLKVLDKSLQMFTVPDMDKLAVYGDIYTRKRRLQNLKVGKFINKEGVDSLLSTVHTHHGIDVFKNYKNICMQSVSTASNKPSDMIASTACTQESLTNNVTSIGIFAPSCSRSFYYVLDRQEKVLKTIKNLDVTGIRVEAAGRLSKRNTAGKSVFKLRYKGNIKDMDSSYKGLSSVILRGFAKSNLQYTKSKSYRRIGSYGVKVWISSFISMRSAILFYLVFLTSSIHSNHSLLDILQLLCNIIN